MAFTVKISMIMKVFGRDTLNLHFLAANVSLLFCHVSWALNTLVEIPLKN